MGAVDRHLRIRTVDTWTGADARLEVNIAPLNTAHPFFFVYVCHRDETEKEESENLLEKMSGTK